MKALRELWNRLSGSDPLQVACLQAEIAKRDAAIADRDETIRRFGSVINQAHDSDGYEERISKLHAGNREMADACERFETAYLACLPHIKRGRRAELNVFLRELFRGS